MTIILQYVDLKSKIKMYVSKDIKIRIVVLILMEIEYTWIFWQGKNFRQISLPKWNSFNGQLEWREWGIGDVSIFLPAASFTLLENMKIFRQGQVLCFLFAFSFSKTIRDMCFHHGLQPVCIQQEWVWFGSGMEIYE